MARQNFIGLVVSQGKMQKTVKVRIQTKVYDKKINKDVLRRKDYLVHDEGELCKEGDIVRIESIPKISARKYFAIAEIKVDKGQQFALYETLAKQKVSNEEQLLIKEFGETRQQLNKIITKVEDLKILDKLVNQLQSPKSTSSTTTGSSGNNELVEEINKIKTKYNIKSWPNVEPILNLKLSETEQNLNKSNNNELINKLMSDPYINQRTEILNKFFNKDINLLKANIQKNLLRKFVSDPKNESTVKLLI